jgi:hypothetical protein
MKILLVTDSHGRDLLGLFRFERKGWNVLAVRVGSTLHAVRHAFMGRISEIQRFQPDCVVFHAGHNDVVFQQKHNRYPQHIKYFFPSVKDF